MAPVVKYLPSKKNVPSATKTMTTKEEPGMVVHACNSRAQETETGELRIQGQPGLHSETPPISKHKQKKTKTVECLLCKCKGLSSNPSLSHTHTHTHTHTHARTHTHTRARAVYFPLLPHAVVMANTIHHPVLNKNLYPLSRVSPGSVSVALRVQSLVNSQVSVPDDIQAPHLLPRGGTPCCS
jgi:hypothetical protein